MDLAASGGSGLGLAVLPLIALFASLVAATAVGSLVVAWLQKPRDAADPSLVDPETVGLLPVAYVSGSASNRWLPAAVVELALDGVLTIEDRRPGGASEDGLDSARGIRLVYASDLPSSGAGTPRDVSPDLVLAVFGPGATGIASVIAHGATVAVDRVVAQNGELAWATRRRFLDTAARYREPRPVGRFRTASVAGVAGVVLGFVAQFVGSGTDDSIAWIALAIGALSLVARAVLPRWIPLNATGLALRERANGLRERIAGADLRDVSVARSTLPWAVLFGQDEVIARAAATLVLRDPGLRWYSSAEPATPERLSSCIRVASDALVQPIAVGDRDDGRLGNRLLEQRGLNTDGGYFSETRGWGRGAIYGGAAGDGFDGGGLGGFDGGGFDGGGFDGGGGGP
ncbi:hypothetical protein [Agromyces binzhouensis]|uniref:DUF2207 domain-containing protein n=1 Tax=Agromyces binzhouensis TaxID=1817495 RepID=A0A4V1QRR5_9MICO|nr:hypothetical protein [Agromyces binzhouensis]RXZ45813.1 hypothetical protein ESO86_13170 [Agromyces binzhouensis]